MKRIWILSLVLLMVAAVEFSLLGASSAGASFVPGWLGGSNGAQPAVRDGHPDCPQHGGCKPTQTPSPAPTPFSPPVSPPACQPDRLHSRDHACDGQPASIQLTPDPLVIHCDGSDHSTLTVRITDANGQPVADGTYVNFGAYNGNTSPGYALTHHGVASTSVTFYGDIFPAGPIVNAGVSVGALEAGVRIRCFPNSNQNPPSPPCSVSPPSVSPPCATPPPSPPCAVSPPSVSPPCATPTPYLTPTPYPTATPSIGGEISFGIPSLANGQIVVPVLTSASPNAWAGLNLHVTFDGSLLSGSAAQTGNAFTGAGVGSWCTAPMNDAGGNGSLVACAILAGSTSNAGTLVTLTFNRQSSAGCARLHLFTLGPPDGGDSISGTYTVSGGPAFDNQQNTYGPDITVDIATGATGCAAPPLPTVTPTPTSTPWSPPPTATATPVVG